MKNNLYSITLLDVSNIKNTHSLSVFDDNLLEIWYFYLDFYPKHYLIENLLEVYNPSKNYGKNSYFNLCSKFLYKFKLNTAKNFNSNNSWKYSNYIYMFNQEGNIIGYIIEVNFNEIIYDNYNYDYTIMINEICEAIKNNAGDNNRYFYIHISDDKNIKYNHININSYSYGRIYYE